MARVYTVALFCLLLAGCGSGGGGGTVERSPDGKVVIETEIAPNGAKVVEFTIRSGASGSLPAGLLPPEAEAEYARVASQVQLGDVGYYRYVGPASSTATPTTQALPDVAGVPQTLTSTTTGNTVTETYTYGTPPPAASAAPAEGGAVDSTAVFGCAAGSSPFQGGTGYCVGR